MANRNSNSGCGCLVLLAIAGIILFCINKCSDSDTKRTKGNDTGQVVSPPQEEMIQPEYLSEEDKKYLNNYLQTGDTPYSNVYGKNYICPYSQCSGIKVTAPTNSDVIVIIKKNNKNGKVCAHGYIREGHTLQLDLQDGIYQTFFYCGKGWNPNKDNGKNMKGGFVQDEVFSKDDNPQEIASCVLEYVLQLKKDGNFNTTISSPSEAF